MYEKNLVKKNIILKTIFQDDTIIIFHNISKIHPIHLVAIPRKKYYSFLEFNISNNTNIIKKFWYNIKCIIKYTQNLKYGYKIIIRNGILKKKYTKHFHVHIIGGEN